MDIVFRGKGQRRRFEALALREMTLTIYPDGRTMAKLGIRDSVMFLLSQIGWDNFTIKRRFSSYRRLTLKVSSSLVYLPSHGIGFNKGLITFRMFDIEYPYNHRELAELLGCPNGPDAFTITQEELLTDLELNYFWGSITGNNHPEPDLMHSENIHNPAIRYFHKILTHTLFGKEQNITSLSKYEFFIMYYASQARPVNVITFIIANLDCMAQANHGPILIGGLVTMIVNVIVLRQSLIRLNPLGGIRPMNIQFCFNTSIIKNLGPDVF